MRLFLYNYTALPFSLFDTFSLVLRQKRRKCMSSVIVVISCGEQPQTTKMEEQIKTTEHARIQSPSFCHKGLGQKTNRKD